MKEWALWDGEEWTSVPKPMLAGGGWRWESLVVWAVGVALQIGPRKEPGWTWIFRKEGDAVPVYGFLWKWARLQVPSIIAEVRVGGTVWPVAKYAAQGTYLVEAAVVWMDRDENMIAERLMRWNELPLAGAGEAEE